ncbi:MAG: YfhO family protein, partial [Chloroflexi bacterium]|nr:YfhO family protein [Chloroflexota bacterium]
FQLLGVGYLITQRTITHGAFTPLASDGDAHLYRYNGARPRVWLVHQARVVPESDVFGALSRDDFDPATSAVLSAAPPVTLDAAPSDDRVEIIQHASGLLSLRTRSAANGLLVFSEIAYPGWQVSVDGRAQPLLSADGVLMAVMLDAGEHDVQLTFDPDLVKIGAALSGISLLLCLGVLLWARRQHGTL